MSMKDNLSELMKQAQQMQSKMQDAQKELTDLSVTGEAGAGLVKIEFNGRHDAKSVELDNSILNDKEMLEDLIAAAINDGARKIEKASQDKLSSLTSGFKMPDNFDFPFGTDDK